MTCLATSILKTCLFFSLIAFIGSTPTLSAANTDTEVSPHVEKTVPLFTPQRHQAFEAVMKLAPYERYIELGGAYVCDDRVRALHAAEKTHSIEGFWKTLDQEPSCGFLEGPAPLLMTDYTIVAEYECVVATVFNVSLGPDGDIEFVDANQKIERTYRGDVFFVSLAPAESCLAG